MSGNIQDIKRIIQILGDMTADIEEKCFAITCLRRNQFEELNSGECGNLKELGAVLLQLTTNKNSNLNQHICRTLDTIIPKHSDFDFLESFSDVDGKKRVEVLHMLMLLKDETVAKMLAKESLKYFLTDCFTTVNQRTTSINDDEAVQKLKEPDNVNTFEGEVVDKALELLLKLYNVPSRSAFYEQIDEVIYKKIIPLAYLGADKQRANAIKMFKLAIESGLSQRLRGKIPDIWTEYKAALQNIYCKRMSTMIAHNNPQWSELWSLSVKFLGSDLHKGSGLVNSLLKVEEAAFKSLDENRREAFVCWKLLIDNFSLDPDELASPRRIKLICVPLNARNSKTEMMVVTKLDVWWHLIFKLYPNLNKFIPSVLIPFFTFCYGPFDIQPVSSKTNAPLAITCKKYRLPQLYAIDAFLQMFVEKEKRPNCSLPRLEDQLANEIPLNIFQETYKQVIHSLREIINGMSVITDLSTDEKTAICTVLWESILDKIRKSKNKQSMFKDVLIAVVELLKQDKVFIKNFVIEVVMKKNADDLLSPVDYQDDIVEIVLFTFLNTKNFVYFEKNCTRSVKTIMKKLLRNEKTYNPNMLVIFDKILELLRQSIQGNAFWKIVSEVYVITIELLTDYVENAQTMGKGNGTVTQHIYKTVENFLTFPLEYTFVKEESEVEQITVSWKCLYAAFAYQTGLMTTTSCNEFLSKMCAKITKVMKITQDSCHLITCCIEEMATNINYGEKSGHEGVFYYAQILNDLVIYSSKESLPTACVALKALCKLLVDFHENTVHSSVDDFGRILLEKILNSIESALLMSVDIDMESIIVNLWSTVVNIFKNLHKHDLLNDNLLSSYQNIFIISLNHSKISIRAPGVTFLAQINKIRKFENKFKELFKEMKRTSLSSPAIIEEKWKKMENNVFPKIKRKQSSGSNDLNSASVASNQTDMKGKVVPPIEKGSSIWNQDSQDFPFFEADIKLDVNLLTDHQKDLLTSRNKTIPALYNDCSSSTQDTQNMQMTFNDMKNHVKRSSESALSHVASTDLNGHESSSEEVVSEDPSSGKEISNKDYNFTAANLQEKNSFSKILPQNPLSDEQCLTVIENPSHETETVEQETGETAIVKSSRIRGSSQERLSADVLTKKGIKRRASEAILENPLDSQKDKRIRRFTEEFEIDTDSKNLVLSERQKNEMKRLQIDMVGFSQSSARKKKLCNREIGEKSKTKKQSNDDIQTLDEQSSKKRIRRSIKKTDNSESDDNAAKDDMLDDKMNITKGSDEDIPVSQEVSTNVKTCPIPICESEIVSEDLDIIENSQEPSEVSIKPINVPTDKQSMEVTKVQPTVEVQSKRLEAEEIPTITPAINPDEQVIENKQHKSVIQADDVVLKNSKVSVFKAKPFHLQSRAAHMLGLVAKQSHSPEIMREEIKAISEIEETEKRSIFSPVSSRQEKIFTNINNKNNKASDSLPPSVKLFATLKNDGENMSSKNPMNIDTSKTKDNEEMYDHRRNDLPLLEWSVNIPSLTASPSASILKKPILDVDDETPNKKKRVSFADPPVSKEMGYQVDYHENEVSSPSRLIKSPISRSPISRKRSSSLKQSHLSKTCSIEKEVDSFATKSNKKEDHQYVDRLPCPKIKLAAVINDLGNQIPQQDEMTDTQDDMFANIESKNPCVDVDKAVDSDSMDTISIQTTDSRRMLEDTVDIGNVNSFSIQTTNSDELLSVKTQENFGQQDTLPVTDSLFSTTPCSQDTQNVSSLDMAQLNQPEQLDSTLPIYPSLISCNDSINLITKELTNPMWTTHFNNVLSNKGLNSVGKFAQLTEQEISRLPIKGESKLELARKVLSKYEGSRKIISNPITNVSSSTPLKQSNEKNMTKLLLRRQVTHKQAPDYPSVENQNASHIISPKSMVNHMELDTSNASSTVMFKRHAVESSTQTSAFPKDFCLADLREICDNLEDDMILEYILDRYQNQIRKKISPGKKIEDPIHKNELIHATDVEFKKENPHIVPHSDDSDIKTFASASKDYSLPTLDKTNPDLEEDEDVPNSLDDEVATCSQSDPKQTISEVLLNQLSPDNAHILEKLSITQQKMIIDRLWSNENTISHVLTKLSINNVLNILKSDMFDAKDYVSVIRLAANNLNLETK